MEVCVSNNLSAVYAQETQVWPEKAQISLEKADTYKESMAKLF
jgi:hypothetical protein